MGTVRRLKELNPAIQAISMQPDSPFHGLEGLKHMATAHRAGHLRSALADRNIEVETEAAYAMAKRLAREEGLLVGISAAAAVVACEQIAAGRIRGGRDGDDRDRSAGFGRQVPERALLGGRMSDRLAVPVQLKRRCTHADSRRMEKRPIRTSAAERCWASPARGGVARASMPSGPGIRGPIPRITATILRPSNWCASSGARGQGPGDRRVLSLASRSSRAVVADGFCRSALAGLLAM